MTPTVATVDWPAAVRIIRSIHPPIDLFEDIADPADWPFLLAAEAKTNPRLMPSLGQLDLVPEARRAGGAGASWLMAPFTHASPDRPGRFHDGSFGALYVGDRFEVALLETVHHHTRFMAATREHPGWTSQFRELVMVVSAALADLRGGDFAAELDPGDHAAGQVMARHVRREGGDGLVYPSVRFPAGLAAALFYPDLAQGPVQGRHLDYHWDGMRVDFYRDASSGQVFRFG